MLDEQILSHVDHTALAAAATKADIIKLCDEAVLYQTATVCIPPSYTHFVHQRFASELRICNVIGFPLGYSVRAAKIAEAEHALADGAVELDMVVNLGDVKNGDFDCVTDEIAALKAVAGGRVLKVIIETCYLTDDEKIALCKCVTDAGADYIKTSTGFGTAGATMADVELFKKHIGDSVKIKAAGGIRSREDMVAFLEAGCDRLGTSSAVKILGGEKHDGY